MFDKINNISFSGKESKETKKSTFLKTNDVPNDSVELSTKQPKSLVTRLAAKLVQKTVKQGEIIEQKRKQSPMQIYQDMIKAGISSDSAKQITENKTLFKRYLLFTSTDMNQEGKLISGFRTPLSLSVAAVLIEKNLDESHIERIQKLLDYDVSIYSIHNLVDDESLFSLISEEVDEKGDLVSGLPQALSKNEVRSIIKFDEGKRKKFSSIVSHKRDDAGNLESGLTRPFTYTEAIDYLNKTSSLKSAQLYLDMLEVKEQKNSYGYSYYIDEIISSTSAQERLLMLTGNEKAKKKSPFSRLFSFEEAINIVGKKLNDEDIDTYIKLSEEGLLSGSRYSNSDLISYISSGYKEKESLLMLMEYHINHEKIHNIELAKSKDVIERFKILTSDEKDEQTGQYVSGTNRKLTNLEATQLAVSLWDYNNQIPKCVQLLNLGLSVDDAIDIVARTYADDRNRFQEFTLLISKEKDENGKLKSGLEKPLSADMAVNVVKAGIAIENVPLFLEMMENGLSLYQSEYFSKDVYSLKRYKELSSNVDGINNSLSPIQIYEIVEHKIKDAQIPRVLELINKETAIACGLDRALTAKEACSVIKEDIAKEQIPLFLEIMSDEKDENGNLKSGLKRKIEWASTAATLIKKGYSKEQIIRFSEVFLLRKEGMFTCIQENQAIDIVENNLSDEEIERYLFFNIYPHDVFDRTSKVAYAPKTVEEREELKKSVFSIIRDVEKFEKYKELTDYDNRQDTFSPYIAIKLLVPEICSDNQIDFYRQIESCYMNYENFSVIIDCAKNKENYEKYCYYTTDFMIDINDQTRPLTKSEAVHAIYNKIEEKNVPQYIKLLAENSSCSPKIIADLLKRNISSSEQIKMYQNMIKHTFFGAVINEKEVIDIISNPQKLERYKLLTSSELDKNSLLLNSVNQTLKRNDNAKLKSGLKRALKSEEAIDFLVPKVIDNKRINEYLSLENDGVYLDQARAIFTDDKKHERFSLLTNEEKNPDGTLKSGLKIKLSPSEAIDLIEQNLDISQINIYIDLIESSVWKHLAMNFVQNPQNIEQYNLLISSETTADGEFKSGLKRALKADEAFEVINSNLNTKQVELLVELVDEHIPIKDVVSVLKDENKYQKLLKYISTEVDENGKLKNKLPRPLTIAEAFKVSEKKLNTSQVSKYIDFNKNGINIDTAIVLAVDFGFLQDKKNINELSLNEKRHFLKSLISHNSSVFGLNVPFSEFSLIPSNQKEYCKILDKLAKSIGIDTRELNNEQKSTCYQGLDEIARVITKSDIDSCQISLDFSREEFLAQAQTILSKLDSLEQRKVMDYFGFEIKRGKLIGYPINVNNGEKLREIENADTKAVVEKLRPIVQRFSVDNKINIPQDKNLEDCLNKILEGLPELRTLVGKVQHKTQDYTLDKHSLKVLQNVVKNPRYQTLSDSDKRLITIATLFHDISKKEGVVDKIHPIESAFDVFYIIQKFNLPEDEQLKLYQLIKTHDWLEKLNKDQENTDKIAKDIAFNMRHSNTFELSQILCEADLKSVKADESFWKNFKDAFIQKSSIIQNNLDILEKSKIVLPQTKIPRASEMKDVETRTANGVTNKVLCIGYCDNDLSKYGFEQDTTVENWAGLVHALDNETQLRNFDTFSIIDSDALLSTSYMNPEEYHVFRKQGLILDVHSSDIHAGYYRDFGSGYTKNLDLLKNQYLFGGSMSEFRTYISSLLKKELELSDEKYVEYLNKIEGCKSITDIEKIDSNFADAIQRVFNKMDSGKRGYGRKYNEMLVSRPKIQGVFSYGQNYDDIPYFLRKYAQDNDLPIIMFGHYK